MKESDAGRRGGAWFRVAWHLAAIGLLATVPGRLVLETPVWELDPGRALHILGLAGAYAAAAAFTSLREGLCHRRPLTALVAGGLSMGFLYLGLLAGRVYYARSILLGGTVAALVLLVVPAARIRYRRPALASLLVAVTASLTASGAATGDGGAVEKPAVIRERIHTAHHSLATKTYRGRVGSPHATGGAIEAVGDRYLLATGDGDLHLLDWAPGTDSLSVERLATRVPLNAEDFAAEVGPRVNTSWFRVADLLVRGTADSLELVASHHYWKGEADCFVLRISRTATSLSRLAGDRVGSGWETLFETEPCLPLEDHERGPPFAGHRGGGRIAALDSARLLLTVGDHGFDGWTSRWEAPRDPDADYGKILVIRRDGSAGTFSMGHRNPQGLLVDPSGTIWSTEHGPEGGDELNRIVRGGDYGWPAETYGTAYGDVEWPGTGGGTGADEGRSPEYAWVPSVGVSNLVSVRPSSPFSRWRGDLLVASLKGRSLFRVERDGREVSYAERIRIGERIRDLVQGRDGRLVLWTDDADLVAVRPAASLDRGAALFRRCVGCHAADEGQAQGMGPRLDGIVGREVASLEGYDYSTALRSLDGRWSRARLDSFLARPQAFAPGTKMGAPGVEDEGDRDALIEYLAEQD